MNAIERQIAQNVAAKRIADYLDHGRNVIAHGGKSEPTPPALNRRARRWIAKHGR